MKTLKEYSEFLHKNGYKESLAPYEFLDGNLKAVGFKKNDYYITLEVDETEEFSAYLSSLKSGTEYQIIYENYNVRSAFIESPICNVPGFVDGSKDGIILVLEPDTYYKHSLDLFKQCIKFQTTNLLEHELFIMSQGLKHLSWAKNNLIPLLEKWDFYIVYDSLSDIKSEERYNSNIRIDFKHQNDALFVIEVDCLTGKPIIWVDTDKTIFITDKIYGRSLNEVSNILLEELLKKDEKRFGYIYNNDPQETIDTYREVYVLLEYLRYNEKGDINLNIIPKRYNKLIDDYNKI